MALNKNKITGLQQDGVKRSLILAGGGMRLAYHAGVLNALEEEGLSFNHVDGTSGGIFGTAMLASGITPVEAARRWRHLNLEGFMGIMPLKPHRKLIDGAAGIREKIFPALGIDIQVINANTSFDATFNVCNFSRKAVESIPGTTAKTDHLVAGVSLPMFIPATRIGNDWYTDGVWIKDANLTEAVNRNAAEIWLIWGIGNTREYLKGYFNEYVHMIEISANAGLIKELDWIKQENARREKEGIAPVVLNIIKPEYPLPLDPDFFFNKIDASTLINMGYADTIMYLRNKKPFDFSDNTLATLMKSFDATLHFRQQFKGSIVLHGKKKASCFYFAIFLRKIKENYVLQQFTSIGLEDDVMISGYDNSITKEKGKIVGSFKFKYDDDVFTVSADTVLSSPYDLVWGMAVKSCIISVTDSKGEQSTGRFYQPALNRIKNSFHLNVNENTGIIKKYRSKYELLKYLCAEEVKV